MVSPSKIFAEKRGRNKIQHCEVFLHDVFLFYRYELTLACWSENSEQRPRFKEIKLKASTILEEMLVSMDG